MFIKEPFNKTLLSDDEDDSNLIINNDDFCSLNDFKNENNIYMQNKNQISQNINNEQDNKYYQSNLIILKNPKVPKSSNDKIKTNIKEDIKNNNINHENHLTKKNNNKERTIFSKITENLYLNTLNNRKPNKIIYDINKIKDDSYNQLTVENYILTCTNKESPKNIKIINDFIERNSKEQKYKKISINQKNYNKNTYYAAKINSREHKKTKRGKDSRSPEQFLDDQQIMELRHNIYINYLIKKHNKEINLCLKDRPTISKQSERLANMNKNNHNKNVHLKLYEESNIRRKNNEEKNKIINEYELGLNKKIDNEQMIEVTKRLFKEYIKKKNNYNENQIKQLNDIKNLSSITLINKKSNDIISKRYINLYKNTINEVFNKNISDNFDIGYGDFLLFIYKLGLVDKIYNDDKQQTKKNIININILEDQNKTGKKDKLDISQNLFSKKEQNNDNASKEVKIRKNKVNYSYKIFKKKIKTKSAEKKSLNKNENFYINDPMFQLTKEAWKIINQTKTFEGDIPATSKRVLIFFLRLCGIYKGNINDIFIRKELPFLVNDKSDLFNIQTARKIYNYFLLYRKSLINKVIEKNKTNKNDSDNSYKLNKNENNYKRIYDTYDPSLKQEKELFIKRKKNYVKYFK